jgi:hypothetical protein
MKHKIETLVSFMCGTSGYGIAMTTIHISPEVLKFTIAMLTAVCAGACGWIGQQGIKALWKFIVKIKTRYGNKKNK